MLVNCNRTVMYTKNFLTNKIFNAAFHNTGMWITTAFIKSCDKKSKVWIQKLLRISQM